VEEVNKILMELFKLPLAEVEKDLTMNDIDGWDSLSHMNLIVTIEDACKIELSGDDIAEMISFEAIRKIVSKYMN